MAGARVRVGCTDPATLQTPAPWCRRLFQDHDPDGLWDWFAALPSTSAARRSVLALWHEFRGRKRQLFEDAEMRRRILGVRSGECAPPDVHTIVQIVNGWRAEAAARARASAAPPGASEPASDPALDGPEDAGQMSTKHLRRLPQLHALLEHCRADGVVEYQDAGPLVSRCVLGWNKLSVHDPPELNARAKAMVLENKDGAWHTARHASMVTNITWPVYETLRTLGLQPRFRGPAAGDPGHHDCLYYREWRGEDRSFEAARLALRAAAGGV